MPTIQTRNQDLEKRLAHLRSQLYGKKPVASTQYQVSRENVEKNINSQNTKHHILDTDLSFLRRDLFKIFILAGLAFTFQFSLYLALLKNIIKLSI